VVSESAIVDFERLVWRETGGEIRLSVQFCSGELKGVDMLEVSRGGQRHSVVYVVRLLTEGPRSTERLDT
jgi:hypothetical protein